mmetsp:Transcript_8156/g.13212  ORF Transcript_8156/g.13212 Transcript_8156/m.13212 type:complete len:339 (+) Transcript_8156:174-1190(+)
MAAVTGVHTAKMQNVQAKQVQMAQVQSGNGASVVPSNMAVSNVAATSSVDGKNDQFAPSGQFGEAKTLEIYGPRSAYDLSGCWCNAGLKCFLPCCVTTVLPGCIKPISEKEFGYYGCILGLCGCCMATEGGSSTDTTHRNSHGYHGSGYTRNYYNNRNSHGYNNHHNQRDNGGACGIVLPLAWPVWDKYTMVSSPNGNAVLWDRYESAFGLGDMCKDQNNNCSMLCKSLCSCNFWDGQLKNGHENSQKDMFAIQNKVVVYNSCCRIDVITCCQGSCPCPCMNCACKIIPGSCCGWDKVLPEDQTEEVKTSSAPDCHVTGVKKVDLSDKPKQPVFEDPN